MTSILTALGFMVLMANASTGSPYATISSTVLEGTTTQEIIDFASSTFQGTPLMAIASCESGDRKGGGQRQFNDDGTVLRGVVNHNDVGLLQINETYHKETAKKMGFDLETVEGNAYYGLYLYWTQGLTPWKDSSDCWSKLIK